MLKRSKFNLSHSNKLTLNMGFLYPILTLDCLPGDKFNISTDCLLRFLPLVAPVMHDVDVCFHYYFVPYRLLWNNGKADCWESFITGASFESGDETIKPVYPYKVFTKTVVGELSDYLGVPTGNWGEIINKDGEKSPGLVVSAMPYRAYACILNNWYFEDFYQGQAELSLSGGMDTVTNLSLIRRNWYKDYFTTAMPSRQLDQQGIVPVTGLKQTYQGTISDTSVPAQFELDDDTKLNVYGNGLSTVFSNFNQNGEPSDDPNSEQGRFLLDTDSTGNLSFKSPRGTPSFEDQMLSSPTGEELRFSGFKDSSGDYSFGLDNKYPHGIVKGGPVKGSADFSNIPVNLSTDESTIGGFSIRELRMISAIQRWKERALDFGRTYADTLLSFFGIRTRDSRLQKPEYLGGFRSPCLFSEVLQTSSTSNSTPQGNMAGHGFSAKIGKPIKYFCPEHGIIMGLLSVMPRPAYFQGLPKKYSKFSTADYYFPDYQGVGPQAIYNQELYANLPDEEKEEIFGYQSRFSEYKSIPSEVHGQFRTSLNYWHLAREFENKPILGNKFLQCDPSNRIFANTDPSDDHLAAHIQHTIYASRPMAKYVRSKLY